MRTMLPSFAPSLQQPFRESSNTSFLEKDPVMVGSTRHRITRMRRRIRFALSIFHPPVPLFRSQLLRIRKAADTYPREIMRALWMDVDNYPIQRVSSNVPPRPHLQGSF